MGRSDQTEYNKQVYAEHMLKAKAEGLCSMLRCKSLAAEGKARCQFHVDRTREQKKANREDRRRKKLCVMRGCDQTPNEGKLQCQLHLDANLAYNRKYNHEFTVVDELNYKAATHCDFCGQPFNGETPSVDHDRKHCPTMRHCRLCTRGLVHWDCNTHAIAWFEWYEDKFGVTDSRLTAYRNRFPVPRTEMVI
jgi:hypothetical protein